ncbi:SDR family NAD(P)-dependent oxidoreductase [Streptomyces parvulus]|uniref:SDR family NAD(P)-dependent oxidoreductase n=2 Tax=Streptomyces parvulus TaxID=146923 RepID=A0A369UZV3_9ACTN|nr:SDR family NAD(P)-dependent oxidoreductase [Streptomyces parvulus]
MGKELVEHTALVTGATAGIGRATALALAARGADIVVHGRDEDRAAETLRRIEALGGTGRFVPADLADPVQVSALAAAAGEVDILVNNASVARPAPTAGTDSALFEAHVGVNLRAPYLLVQALAPGMTERGRGAIINISSGAASLPAVSLGIYGATKAGLESLTRVWAAEYGPAGVRVNAVAVGPTRTESTAVLGDAFELAGHGVALGRVAEADEIAGPIAFLASPAAAYVNGAVIEVLGGHPPVG